MMYALLAMGFHFRVEHANVVAFVTTPAAEPPSVPLDLAREFVGALVHPNPSSFLVSRDKEWLGEIRGLAREALERIDAAPRAGRMLDKRELENALAGIRENLSSFELYGLVVPPVGGGSYEALSRWRRSSEVVHAANFLAQATNANALILFPEDSADSLEDDNGEDALPAFAAVAGHWRDGPGIVFWTQRGTAAFVRENDVDLAAQDLLGALRAGRPSELDAVLRKFERNPTRRILHLSDLHFGRPEAARNLGMLQAELSNVVGAVDRVVITGDLFDNPDPVAAASFRAFSQNLERMSGSPPVAVPGNHDQRILGNLGQTFEQVSQLPWAPVVVDENAQIMLVSLNSSIRGSFAKGRVTKDQLTAVGSDIMNRHAMSPATRHYLRIVLVHHHPFPFETAPTTFAQRFLSMFGVTDETFLLLEDAEDFLEWCARWQVSVILHGHKHHARFASRKIKPDGAPPHLVTAIGCGTSLGAEGFPASYNIVHWDEQRRRWMARFFESRDGAPFLPKVITLSRQAEEPVATPM